MNNYKIIDSRPELTSAQVLGGMNFAIVKAGALASTTTIAGVIITKGLITKGFITALVVSSALLICHKDNEQYDSEENQNSITKAMTRPDHYGEKTKLLEETSQVVTTSIKPRIIIPTIAPTGKIKDLPTEPKTEITSNAAVPTLTSPTTVMSAITMSTITLSNPGPAVCQPHSNNHAVPPFNKFSKDSIK